MSGAPLLLRSPAKAASTAAASADVDRDGAGGEPVPRQGGGDALRRGRVAIGDGDRATLRRQHPRDRFADPGAAAGDDRDATFEIEVHVDRVAVRACSSPSAAERLQALLDVDGYVALMPGRHRVDRQCADAR